MALPNLCARPKISFILIFSLCLFQMKSTASAAVTTPNTAMPARIDAASEQQTRNQVAHEDKTASEPMVPTGDIDTETTATGATTDTSSNANWWRNAIFYQIYPRSFMDSDGDGVGDLKGITMKLPYLVETGIHAVWLSPIFKSPMVDFGYDISDFRAIHPEYGTMEDFEALIAEAKRLGIKIILDFVPNHTSNESDWFQKSAAREDGYEDFYVWADGKMDANGERMPPNNWQSVFYGSAWTWHDTRQQYYLHQFTAGQPDLNFRNSKVVAAMDEVLHYWLQRGVSGFRVDAINHMFEDTELRDEPLSGTTDDKLSYGYTDHIYTKDLPEVLEMLQHWRRLLDDFTATHGGPARILMTEAYSDVKRLMDYYETADGRLGAHFPFNFNLMTDLNEQSDARDYVFNMHKWLTYMPRGHAANWVMGNHDNPRMASRHGAERVDAMNMLLMTLPGVAVTYNGEEIGMQDYRDMSWDDTVDPPARNVGPQKYKMVSRDPERTPFQWNANKNAGFSTADKTWLPVHPNFKQLNLEQQQTDHRSHYQVYKELVQLRKLPAMRKGRLHAEVLNRNVFAFERELKGHGAIMTVINIAPEAQTVNLSEAFDTQRRMTVMVADSKSTRTRGQEIRTDAVKLLPYEGLVCMLE